MKLQLVAVGTKMPDWVQTGFMEYLRRFPKDMPFELTEVPAGKRGKNADIKRILEKEGEAMLAATGKGNRIVTLDIPGQPWETLIKDRIFNPLNSQAQDPGVKAEAW